MATQPSSTATAPPRIRSSVPLLKRRRTGARGGPFEISTRISSPGVDVPDPEGSAEAGRLAAGSGTADRRRTVPDRQTGETSASRRRHLSSISGPGQNEVYQGSTYP